MKKLLVIICASSLFLLGLIGISGAKVTISVWDEFSAPPTRDAADATYKAFQKAYPEINLAVAHFENTPYEWVLKAAFAGGEPPNVVEVNNGADLFEKVRAGVILDITDFFRGRINRLMVSPSIFELGGKYWGVPSPGADFGNLIWHNVDIMKENGINVDSLHTWSGFIAACEKLKNNGITPIAFGNKEGWCGNHWWTHLLFRLLGAKKYEELNFRSMIPGWKTDLKYTDPPAVKAWELYSELWEKGYFPPGAAVDDFAAASTYFFAGKAGFIQNGCWFVSTVRYSAPHLPVGYTWFPTVEGYPGKYGGIITGGQTYALSTNNTPETKEAALKFLDYMMTEDEAGKIWVEIMQLPPAYKISLAGIKVDPFLESIMKDASRAPESAPYSDVLINFDIAVEYTWKASQAILTGDLTPQEVAERLEKAVQEWEKEHPEKEILPSPSLRD